MLFFVIFDTSKKNLVLGNKMPNKMLPKTMME